MKRRIHAVPLSFQLPIDEKRSVERVVCSFIVLGKQVCLVDTGTAGGEQAIVDYLMKLGKSPSDVSLIINTHEHPDHIGGNHFFKMNSNCVFACHSEAAAWIENHDLQYDKRPIFGFHELAGNSVSIKRKLQDGDVIDLGDTSLQVIFTPGHSPGSISLFCPQERTVIVGDAIQPVLDLPLYNDVAKARASLKRLAEFSGVERMYGSVSEKVFIGSEIKDAFLASLAYLDGIDRILYQLREYLEEGVSPEDITRKVLLRLGLDPPPVMPITVQSIMSHLP